MAKSPSQMTVKVEGELVLRLKNGDEYPLGDVEWEMPVRVHYVPGPGEVDE